MIPSTHQDTMALVAKVAGIISVLPGTSSEHGRIAGEVVNIITSTASLARTQALNDAKEAVKKVGPTPWKMDRDTIQGSAWSGALNAALQAIEELIAKP